MVGPAIGETCAPGEAAGGGLRHGGGEALGDSRPGRVELSGGSGGADRIQAEIEVEVTQCMATPRREIEQAGRRRKSARAGIDADLDEIQQGAVQGRLEGVYAQAEAARRRTAGDDQRQGVGSPCRSASASDCATAASG